MANIHGFDGLIAAIQKAVSEAHKTAQEQHLGLMDKFFERQPDGTFKPKVVKIQTPSMRPGAKPEDMDILEVPLVTFANLNGISIKELSVEFKVRIDGLAQDQNQDGVPDDEQEDPNFVGPLVPKNKSRLMIGLSGGGFLNRGTEGTVKIIFSGGDPPEGVMKVNDQMVRRIS